jgi:putative hydrolase of the HAD superfamily
MREHSAMLQACAEILQVNLYDLIQMSEESYSLRVRGEFASGAENFGWIIRKLGIEAPSAATEACGALWEQFTRECLILAPETLELFRWLRSNGLRIGLVTNCAPDVPSVWTGTAAAPYFDFCAFSCQLGYIKPEPEIYLAAVRGLGVYPRDTLYVGDGSDRELWGAKQCGMQPILLTADLSNTYDSVRADVDGWSGPRVQTLTELRCFIGE